MKKHVGVWDVQKPLNVSFGEWTHSTIRLETVVCVTGQHKEMLEQVLDVFQVTPDDLGIMKANQTLFTIMTSFLRNPTSFGRATLILSLSMGTMTTTFAICLYMGTQSKGKQVFWLTIFKAHILRSLTKSSYCRLQFRPTQVSKGLQKEGRDRFCMGQLSLMP